MSCFDPQTKTFRNYFRSDGLVNSEFNRQSACKLADGSLMMGGTNGIDWFHPDSLSDKQAAPQVQIAEFNVFNNPVQPGTKLELRNHQNHLSFAFAEMDFTNPSRNKFAYKLEGADKDWIFSGNRNYAVYSSLPPGRYRFLVKGANSSGAWGAQPTALAFVILPAWYQSWWFYAVAALAAALFVYGIFQLRLRQKLQIFRLRNRLHRDLHDDVGATLSSIKAYSEILGRNGSDTIIQGLIRENATEMIDRLEVISWATNPQHDNARSLVEAMLRFANPVAHAQGIRMHFTKAVNDSLIIPGDVRQHLLLIFKEAINNILKYAEATECCVALALKGQMLIMQIRDNGKGYNGQVKGTGSVLKNMRKRASEMRGTMEIKSVPGDGTAVWLAVPYPFRLANTSKKQEA